MKIPTPEERARALLRIEKQTSREVAKCFSDLVDRVISRLGAFPEGSPLTPGENPAFARMLDGELTRFSRELEEANERGVTRAWTLSDHYGDIDTRGYLRRTGATALLASFSYSTPEAETARRAEAVRAFLDRRDRGGFTPSGRVWRTAEQAMQHIETSLSEGLAEGRSAAELSRTIRQDLREPERLYRRVRDKNGILELSKPAKAYHPGAGVYRSSYRNALRLTRTEINVSYAEADFERWQGLDFVIGYEVRLSNNHTCNGHPFTDICDELAGRYPKWFKFTKWHPQCRCVATPIFDDDPGAGEVRDVSPNFKQWVTDNQPRLDRSIKKGTAPYWVRDNFSKQGKLTGAGRKPAPAGGGSKPPKQPDKATKDPEDLFYLYKDYTKKGGGRMLIDTSFTPEDKHQSDYYKIRRIGDHFAKQGCEVQMPKQRNVKSEEYSIIYGSLRGTRYWGKCPDLMVNGKPYEFESYKRAWTKHKVGNMMNNGLKQSPNIIIDNTNGCSDRMIRRKIYNKSKQTAVEEVWIYEKGNIRRIK